MRHLPDFLADTAWQKLSLSVIAFIANAVGGLTFDGAYKGLLFILAAVNLVWALLYIRKLLREQRPKPPDVGV